MKKTLLFILIILIPYVSAITTDVKEAYNPGETLITEISGNILGPIEKENIELKRKNVQVPIDYDLKKIDDKYFLYVILPSQENNYTLFIREIATMLNGQAQTIDHNESIIVQGNLTSYSVRPGFFIGYDPEFDIFLNKDFAETITSDFPEENQIVLSPGNNAIKISSAGAEPGFRIINLGMYSIPILITDPGETGGQRPEITFFPVTIDRVILMDESPGYTFTITNNGPEILEDLFFDFDEELFILDPIQVSSIDPEESLEVSISLKNTNQPIDDIISLVYQDFSYDFPVVIEYTENQNEVTISNDTGTGAGRPKFFCSELGGTLCAAGEVCSGETLSSLDSPSCCTGLCTIPDETTSYAWVGWLIGIIVLIILIIIAGRYMKTKRSLKNPLERRLKSKGSLPPRPKPSSSLKKIQE